MRETRICKTLIWIMSILTILVGCTLIPDSPEQAHPDKTDADITVKDNPGKGIPSNFVGFSIEMSQICEILQLDTQNPSYEQLYKNLGSGILRFGGNTADLSEWSPGGEISCASDHAVITESLIDRVFAFAHRINWKVIWGLNLNSYDPTSAANEATYVATAGGSALIGFTIGNEPELYVEDGHRPSWWDYQNYNYEWEQYKSSILQMTQASFIGPEACCEKPFFANFLGDEAPQGLEAASHHFYAMMSTATGDNAPSIPLLLSKHILQDEVAFLNEWEGNASRYGVPLALTEVNSVDGGGQTGVSDTLTAALWANDFLFQAARYGISTVEFHSSSNASYNAIDDNGNATPLYYGLLLFHYCTLQAHFLEADIQTKINITAYALAGANNTLSVIVINKDSNSKTIVGINTGSYSQGTAISLTAPGLASTTGVILGQRTLSQQGTWVPNPVSISMRGNTGYVEIPAGSATVVTFKRA